MNEQRRVMPRLRALPFFVPGWLYFPMLWYGIPRLPDDLNENVLSLVVQVPALLSLAVLYPLSKRWTTMREVGWYLVFPNLLIAGIWFSTLSR